MRIGLATTQLACVVVPPAPNRTISPEYKRVGTAHFNIGNVIKADNLHRRAATDRCTVAKLSVFVVPHDHATPDCSPSVFRTRLWFQTAEICVTPCSPAT